MKSRRVEAPQPGNKKQKAAYQKPKILHVFQMEAQASICIDLNSKAQVELGCNPGALYS